MLSIPIHQDILKPRNPSIKEPQEIRTFSDGVALRATLASVSSLSHTRYRTMSLIRDPKFAFSIPPGATQDDRRDTLIEGGPLTISVAH